MTVNVITVSEDLPVDEVVGLLLKYRISAVPVVDGAQKVVGIVSEGDLLRPEGRAAPGRTVRGGWRRPSPDGQWPTKRRRAAPPAR